MLFRRCYKISSYSDMPCYKSHLKTLNILSLEKRRIILDLSFCFKILRKESRLQASKYWMFGPSTPRSCSFNLHYQKINRIHFSKVFNSVFNRFARWAHNLANDVLQAKSSVTFSKRLRNVDLEQITGINLAI